MPPSLLSNAIRKRLFKGVLCWGRFSSRARRLWCFGSFSRFAYMRAWSLRPLSWLRFWFSMLAALIVEHTAEEFNKGVLCGVAIFLTCEAVPVVGRFQSLRLYACLSAASVVLAAFRLRSVRLCFGSVSQIRCRRDLRIPTKIPVNQEKSFWAGCGFRCGSVGFVGLGAVRFSSCIMCDLCQKIV